MQDLTCYEYKIRARNVLCEGEWSEFPNSKFVTGGPPSALGTPETALIPMLRGPWNGEAEEFNNPSIQISWPAPDPNEMVTSYSVFILNMNSIFLENKIYCDGSEPMVIDTRVCRIPMSLFWDGNWELD